MHEERNVFRLHLFAVAADVSSQLSSFDSRMGLYSKEPHRGTAITAGRSAKPVAIGPGPIGSWWSSRTPLD